MPAQPFHPQVQPISLHPSDESGQPSAPYPCPPRNEPACCPLISRLNSSWVGSLPSSFLKASIARRMRFAFTIAISNPPHSAFLHADALFFVMRKNKKVHAPAMSFRHTVVDYTQSQSLDLQDISIADFPRTQKVAAHGHAISGRPVSHA